jgi:hypothetical protein
MNGRYYREGQALDEVFEVLGAGVEVLRTHDGVLKEGLSIGLIEKTYGGPPKGVPPSI